MAVDHIRYDLLAQDALRGMVRRVLQDIVRDGLPGEHHFFVTFDTRAPGVRLSTRLRERYPEEMTIVLQHQFWDLVVTEQAFEVGLSFNGIPERLLVPFSALKQFVDPSVQFGLQFEVVAEGAAPEAAPDTPAEPEPDAAPTAEAEPAKPRRSVPAAKSRAATPPAPDPQPAPEPPAANEGSATVVRLDSFRKK